MAKKKKMGDGVSLRLSAKAGTTEEFIREYNALNGEQNRTLIKAFKLLYRLEQQIGQGKVQDPVVLKLYEELEAETVRMKYMDGKYIGMPEFTPSPADHDSTQHDNQPEEPKLTIVKSPKVKVNKPIDDTKRSASDKKTTDQVTTKNTKPVITKKQKINSAPSYDF